MRYYGDGKDEIREIAFNATRRLMHKLTVYGVKFVLSELQKGIEDSKSWRVKMTSI